MPPYSGPKRKLEDFDPNASDPNDSDFEDAAPSRPSASNRRRSHKKPNRGSSGGHLHSKKRARRRYGTDDSDIVVDDDDEISEEPFTESDEDEAEVELNPRTGRAVRSAVKNNDVKYEESDADEEVFIEETADEADELTISPQKNRLSRRAQPQKLIVKLVFSKWTSLNNFTVPQTRRSTRSRTASKPPVTAMRGTRKSSRLSQEPESYMELSSSGRHAAIRHPGTSSPEQIEIGGRRTRGGKGPRGSDAGKQPRKGMVSDIIEVSQDHTDRASEEEPEVMESDGDGEAVPKEVPEEVLESVEHAHPEEEDEDAAADADAATDVAPVEELVEEVRERTQSDASEGPVRRSARNLRVSADDACLRISLLT
jgi:hypothetical protein